VVVAEELGQFDAARAIILRHCERSEAIHLSAKKVWIASRSLSSGAHSRDPLARNGGD
jgi:hypothetical protein